MPVSRRCLAALVAAGLLAAPAPALGQSAGDEQYQDPFAGEDQEQPSSSPDEPVQDDGGGATEPAAPAPDPAATGQEPAPAPAPAESAPETAAQPELPRTGADAGAVLLAGSILLAGGVALRIRLRA
jgi:Meckel syndrome type 1 protein